MDKDAKKEGIHKDHILLVEDNPDNIELAKEILSEEGYHIGVAKNGLEALNYIEKNPIPDLILLDIAMPVMDGFQTCKRLKENPDTQHTPIIFLSALNDTANIVKGFELGAVDYVFKPFNFYELISRVKTHIELKHSREKLVSVNHYLEKVVDERTQELRLAYDRLEHLDKAKTEFLSLISHELRTPLNGIIGYFSLVNEMNDEPVMDANFKGSVEELIHKLLRFSDLSILFTELRASYYDSKNIDINIKEKVQSIVDQYQQTIEKKNLHIALDIKKEQSIQADDYLITNCLDIVMDNAFKFSPERSEVKIEVKEIGEFIQINISDDGPGFTDKARNYLFELFEADNYSNTYSGFGLGMATVKLILDTIGGKIEVKNKNGSGAIVELYFKKN